MRTIDVAGTPVDVQLDEGEIVLDVIVLMRVTRFDSERGTTSLIVSAGEDTDLIIQTGMLAQAHRRSLDHLKDFGEDGE